MSNARPALALPVVGGLAFAGANSIALLDVLPPERFDVTNLGSDCSSLTLDAIEHICPPL
ncbi:MAG TPA: hypothetical protein VGQ57_06880 [Polyangiaceae bacterium]|nr:hypothetical protein [Polyangiaceae bacterium]